MSTVLRNIPYADLSGGHAAENGAGVHASGARQAIESLKPPVGSGASG